MHTQEPGVEGISPLRDLAPQGEISSDMVLSGARSLGISPPFRDLPPPPPKFYGSRPLPLPKVQEICPPPFSKFLLLGSKITA